MTDPADLLAYDTDIAAIRGYFTGKRLEIFDEAVAALRESVEQGAWVGRSAQRVSKGLNKGITSYRNLCKPCADASLFAVFMASAYGRPIEQAHVDAVSDADLARLAPTVHVYVMRSWLRLLAVVRAITEDLDASRPAPAITEIGLSPKVTATLRDVGLDLDLGTRRMCPLGWYWAPALDSGGRRKKVYYPKWPASTIHGSSRFAHCDCHACGKSIPSGKVVPVIVDDHAGTAHGFWLGRDCAANILGIKDAGISADAKAPA